MAWQKKAKHRRPPPGAAVWPLGHGPSLTFVAASPVSAPSTNENPRQCGPRYGKTPRALTLVIFFNLLGSIAGMSSVTSELEETLHQLDASSALLLERLVRDALELVRQGAIAPRPTDSKGWPRGYFEQTAGSFAGEPLEIPDDPPPTANPGW